MIKIINKGSVDIQVFDDLFNNKDIDIIVDGEKLENVYGAKLKYYKRKILDMISINA